MRSESVPVSTEGITERGILASSFPEVIQRDKRHTILLVEDEDRVRRVISAVLRLAGYTVVEANDAEGALGAAAQRGQSLHLLVTDVVLPGRSGRELARELQGRLPAMKAILISGYGESIALMGGTRSANVRYLAKPFSAGLLVEAVRALLRDSGAVEERVPGGKRAASRR